MGDYLGTYRGVVVNTNDPRAEGRITLRIPQILGPTESAWATPSAPVTHLPNPGDSVFVTFESGDVAYPIYHGTSDTGAIPKQPTALTLAKGSYATSEGVTLGTVTASWTAPTENQDGSVPISLGGYFASYSYDNATWSGEYFTPDTSIQFGNIRMGTKTYVRVASLSGQAQRLSPYATANITTDAAPATLPAGSTLDSIQKTANGKNSVTYSTSLPGSAPNTAGDIWFQYDSTSTYIISQWQGTGGTGWISRQLDGQTIANLNVGRLVAGSISAGQKIIAGPVTDVHAELSDTGFRAFAKDADGNVLEAVRMGTSTSDLLSMTDASGNTVAAISDSGLISGSGASLDATAYDSNNVPSGVAIYGKDFTDWQAAKPDGIKAQAYRSGALSGSGISGETGIYEISWTHMPGRLYRVSFWGGTYNSTTTDVQMSMRIRYTTDGSAPTINSTLARTAFVPLTRANQAITAPAITGQGNWIGSNTSPTVVRALITIGVFGGTGTVGYNNYGGLNYNAPFEAAVDDMGLDVQDTFVLNNGAATGNTTTVKQNYVKTYYSNGWGTYRSINGAVRGTNTSPGDTSNYIYQGYSSSGSYNGDQRGLWTFPSITSDVGSGTVTKVEAYIYANHWYYSAGGTAKIALHNYLSVPGSLPTLSYSFSSSGWPNPGGRWLTLPSSTYAGWASGQWRGFGVGPAGTTDLTYYGYFNAAAQLRVSYNK